MVLKQHGMKDSMYLKEKRHVTFALKYTFLLLAFIKCKLMGSGKLLSTTCCISNWRLFDDGTASEDGDVCLSVVAVVLVVL